MRRTTSPAARPATGHTVGRQAEARHRCRHLQGLPRRRDERPRQVHAGSGQHGGQPVRPRAQRSTRTSPRARAARPSRPRHPSRRTSTRSSAARYGLERGGTAPLFRAPSPRAGQKTTTLSASMVHVDSTSIRAALGPRDQAVYRHPRASMHEPQMATVPPRRMNAPSMSPML